MNRRRVTKTRRENFVVQLCCDWFSRLMQRDFSVCSRGDENKPPDGLICDGYTTHWIEVVNASPSCNWDRYSERIGDGYVPNLPNLPMYEPDLMFAKTTAHRVGNKLSHRSYGEVYQRYGPGLLAISIFYPLISDSSWQALQREFQELRLSLSGTFFFNGVLIAHPFHSSSRQFIELNKLLPSS